MHVGTYRLIRTLPAEVGPGLYAGIFGEIGNAWLVNETPSAHDLHRSVTLILGAETIIGPLLLAYARADGSNQRFYVTIGKTF